MEKHKCKLCLKLFANGKALGGHMRSHMLNLYVNPNPKPSPSPSPSPSSSEELKSEMSRNPTARQRSKRVRRPESSWFGDQQHLHEFNHIKDQKLSPEEVVAYCLMMLSRDTWTHDEQQQQEQEEEEEEDDDELESESDEEVVEVKQTQTRNSYRCETCKRRFKSYQALGGHIASHKRIKLNEQFQHNNKYHETRNVLVKEKSYECHVCFKVFASGQALGGHKRSHVTSKQVVEESFNLIDLNLPAPSDDDDDEDDD